MEYDRGMKSNHPDTRPAPLPRWYRGADVPMKLIRRFARQVAERFQPEKIILFGSYAYGQPHADSDVDILVIMPTRNELDQSVKICLAVDYSFPLDLLVRTPKNLTWRLAEGDSFLLEVMDRGKVLYEKTNGRLGPKGRGRSPSGRKTRSKPATGK
jgi:predicted nucleotidyltransferase